VATNPTRDQVADRITEAITAFGPKREQVVPEATWAQLGLDSLHLVELAEIAANDYDTELKGEDFEGLVTVGDAIEMVWSRAQAPTPSSTGPGEG